MKLSDYTTSGTSNSSPYIPYTMPHIPYATPSIELPKISKKIVKNFINDATICCVDSREEYKYPVLFYIAGENGKARSGSYLFAISGAGNLELFNSIDILDIEVGEGGHLKIIGVDLI